MSREEQYMLSIVCKPPHGRYSRDIPFQREPTADDIFLSIHRLRCQATVCGGTETVVQIESVNLVKIIKVETLGICLQTINETKAL